MPLKTFDPMQTLDIYRAGQERQRVGKLQEYKQGRREEMDRRGDVAYQRSEEERPGLQAIAKRKRNVESTQELMELGQKQLQYMNPESESFQTEKEDMIVEFSNEMNRLGFGPEEIRAHSKKMISLTPENIMAAQEKAGFRRKAAKGMTEYQRKSLGQRQKALDIKATEKAEDIKTKKQAAIDILESSLGTIDRLLEGTGLESAAGWQSDIWTKGGTPAANFEAVLETLQSQNFLSQVKQMKGMGALSENEGKKLGASIGSLSLNMSDKALRAEIIRIKAVFNKAKDKMTGIKAGKTAAQELPKGVSEDDIAETMKANNMTREQVMTRLSGQ